MSHARFAQVTLRAIRRTRALEVGCLLLLAIGAGCPPPHWRPVGPAPQWSGGLAMSGHAELIARPSSADGAAHPALYLGSETGGVWRSTDYLSKNPRWQPTTVHLPLPLDSV